jgi:biopolymer transport protein ExbB/TolQ
MDQIISQISIVFDIVITCLLATTIFFAIKLSRHLDSFRSNRASMKNLIRELSGQITRAQEGISVLDELSANRGDELRASISKASELSDIENAIKSGLYLEAPFRTVHNTYPYLVSATEQVRKSKQR